MRIGHVVVNEKDICLALSSHKTAFVVSQSSEAITEYITTFTVN